MIADIVKLVAASAILSAVVAPTAVDAQATTPIGITRIYSDAACSKLESETFMDVGGTCLFLALPDRGKCTLVVKDQWSVMDCVASVPGLTSKPTATTVSQVWSDSAACIGDASIVSFQYVPGRCLEAKSPLDGTVSGSQVSQCQADGSVVSRQYSSADCSGTPIQSSTAQKQCTPVANSSGEMTTSIIATCTPGAGVVTPVVGGGDDNNTGGSDTSTGVSNGVGSTGYAGAANLRCYQGSEQQSSATGVNTGDVYQVNCDGSTKTCQLVTTTSGTTERSIALACVPKDACVTTADPTSTNVVTTCYRGVTMLPVATYAPTASLYVPSRLDEPGAAGSGVKAGVELDPSSASTASSTASWLLTVTATAAALAAARF